MRYSTFALWKAAADKALLQLWGINYADAGADESDLQRWFADHTATGETPLELARTYGEDYDLIEPDPITAQDLKRRHYIPLPDICATPEQVARATAPVFFTGDPNFPTEEGAVSLEPNECYAAGSYGTVCFDATTGKVTRHFPGMDFAVPESAEFAALHNAWQPGYLDVAQFDLTTADGPVKPGDIFDICYIGFTTDAGVYVEAEKPEIED